MKALLLLLLTATLVSGQQSDSRWFYLTNDSSAFCMDSTLLVFFASVAFFTFACQMSIGFMIYTNNRPSIYKNPYYDQNNPKALPLNKTQ